MCGTGNAICCPSFSAEHDASLPAARTLEPRRLGEDPMHQAGFTSTSQALMSTARGVANLRLGKHDVHRNPGVHADDLRDEAWSIAHVPGIASIRDADHCTASIDTAQSGEFLFDVDPGVEELVDWTELLT
jgi:hypothetical protein